MSTGILKVFILISTTCYGNGYKAAFLKFIVICTSLASNQIELDKNILPSTVQRLLAQKSFTIKNIIYLFLISNPSV